MITTTEPDVSDEFLKNFTPTTFISDPHRKHLQEDAVNRMNHSKKLRNAAARLSRLAGSSGNAPHFRGRTDNQLIEVIRELQAYLDTHEPKPVQPPKRSGSRGKRKTGGKG
jgi:hypothetical protein